MRKPFSRRESPGLDPEIVRLTRVGLVTALVFAGFLFSANAFHPASDAWAVTVSGWQLGTHGNLDMSAFAGNSWIVPLDDGTYAPARHGGAILVAALFYRVMGSPDLVTALPIMTATAAMSTLAVLVMFLVLRRLLSRGEAVVATAIFTLGTATWAVAADQMWTHGPAQLGCALAMLMLAKNHYLLGGLALGFAIMMRPHLAVAALAIGLYIGWRKRSVAPIFWIGLGSSAGLVGLVAFNQWVFGSGSPVAAYGGYATARVSDAQRIVLFEFPVNLIGHVVSPLRGVLWLSPWIVLLLPGIWKAWRAAPPWIRASALGGLVYFVAQSWANYFLGGWGYFGNRLVLESLTLMAPLLALSWTAWTLQTTMRRVTFIALAGYSMTIHTVAAVIPWSPPDTAPWRSYLLVDYVNEAPVASALVILLGISMTTAACLGIRRWDPPSSAEQDLEDVELARPGP